MPGVDEKSVPPLFVLHAHSSPVLCCCFYPSETYHREQSSWFLSGDVDGTVILWNLTTRRPIATLSALEEARRQVLESAPQQPQSSKTKVSCKNDVSVGASAVPNPHPAELGPYSRSVLSVGFIPTSVALAASSSKKETWSEEDVSSGVLSASHKASEEGKGATCDAVVVASPTVKDAFGVPRRQRFRLTRRVGSRAFAVTSSSSPELTSVVTSFSQTNTKVPLTVCFYTHCRDQRVYIWSLSHPFIRSTDGVSSLQLLAALTAPQHGFCPVESITATLSGASTTYLAVPHDSQGEITIWELGWRHGEKRGPRSTDKGRHVANSSGGKDASSDFETHSSGEESADAEEGGVDTTGMSPMDALIARTVAQERREEKRLKKQKKDSVAGEQNAGNNDNCQGHSTDSFVQQSRPPVSRTERTSFLCYVAPFATARDCGFFVRRLCSFSACPHFKGGIIMRLTMCADAQHLGVAFESGHVVLARFRVAGELSPSYCNNSANSRNVEPSILAARIAVLPVAHVRCAVRAFAESALACWWGGQRVLACSADGGLHCYEVTPAPHEAIAGEPPRATDDALKVQLLWSATLRKGIGSVCKQANLIIAGCWDSTLRLYDARDGRLVSILSYQQETINEVRMAPSAIARVAAFGFDPRQPRCYAPLPPPPPLMRVSIPTLQSPAYSDVPFSANCAPIRTISATTTSGAGGDGILTRDRVEGEEELVYLFGSASKDGSVALWRVDMQLIAEKAAWQFMST